MMSLKGKKITRNILEFIKGKEVTGSLMDE